MHRMSESSAEAAKGAEFACLSHSEQLQWLLIFSIIIHQPS